MGGFELGDWEGERVQVSLALSFRWRGLGYWCWSLFLFSFGLAVVLRVEIYDWGCLFHGDFDGNQRGKRSLSNAGDAMRLSREKDDAEDT